MTSSDRDVMQIACELHHYIRKIADLTPEQRKKLVSAWHEVARANKLHGLVEDWIDDVIDYYG